MKNLLTAQYTAWSGIGFTGYDSYIAKVASKIGRWDVMNQNLDSMKGDQIHLTNTLTHELSDNLTLKNVNRVFSNLNVVLTAGYYPGYFANSRLPGYSVYNMRLEVQQIAGSEVTAALWVKNLTKKEYFNGAMPMGLLLVLNSAMVGNPRTFGAEVSFKSDLTRGLGGVFARLLAATENGRRTLVRPAVCLLAGRLTSFWGSINCCERRPAKRPLGPRSMTTVRWLTEHWEPDYHE